MPTELKLDRQVIETKEPGQLAASAHDQIFTAVEGKRDYKALILALPQHWRAVYTTSLLEGEVNNGGFHQFFWNSEGKFNEAVLADLDYIGATAYHDLFRRAVAIYAGHNYDEEKKRAGTSWEGFTEAYKQKRFEELDEEFYKVKLDMDVLIGNFIKQHPELYSVPASKGN